MSRILKVAGLAVLLALPLGSATAEPPTLETWRDDAGHSVVLARVEVPATSSPTIDRDRATLIARGILSARLREGTLRGSRVVWERRYDDPVGGRRMHVVVVGWGRDLQSVATAVVDSLDREWTERHPPDSEPDGTTRGNE